MQHRSAGASLRVEERELVCQIPHPLLVLEGTNESRKVLLAMRSTDQTQHHAQQEDNDECQETGRLR